MRVYKAMIITAFVFIALEALSELSFVRGEKGTTGLTANFPRFTKESYL